MAAAVEGGGNDDEVNLNNIVSAMTQQQLFEWSGKATHFSPIYNCGKSES